VLEVGRVAVLELAKLILEAADVLLGGIGELLADVSRLVSACVAGLGGDGLH
jgi:hypothetical protein